MTFHAKPAAARAKQGRKPDVARCAVISYTTRCRLQPRKRDRSVRACACFAKTFCDTKTKHLDSASPPATPHFGPTHSQRHDRPSEAPHRVKDE